MWHAFSKAGPGTCGTNAPDSSDTARLPEPWLLQEAYENLLLIFHPQTQHRATYHSGDGVLIEPMLALYCPIEGGDYVINATVREIATRVGADVVVMIYHEWCSRRTLSHGMPASASILLRHSCII